MPILVVDDDVGLRKAVRRVLVAQGFEVETALFIPTYSNDVPE
jgi:DNA-binding response OmpR family regulator